MWIFIILAVILLLSLSGTSERSTGVIHKRCNECKKYGMDCRCKKTKKTLPPKPIK